MEGDGSSKYTIKDVGHTIGAVSRYDQEYLRYYLPDVNVEVLISFSNWFDTVHILKILIILYTLKNFDS